MSCAIWGAGHDPGHISSIFHLLSPIPSTGPLWRPWIQFQHLRVCKCHALCSGCSTASPRNSHDSLPYFLQTFAPVISSERSLLPTSCYLNLLFYFRTCHLYFLICFSCVLSLPHQTKWSMQQEYAVFTVVCKDKSWVFIGRTDAEAETPILWPPHAKS